MARADFDLKGLYEAMDDRRRSPEMSWAAVTREINHFVTDGHPVSSSTITGVKDKAITEGDGILQMLQWLRRTPESFVPGFVDADSERFHLQPPVAGRILRWDATALHAALNAKRQAAEMTWKDVANAVGGISSGMLTHLAKGGRVGFPGVMRMTAWLGQPATTFTRLVPRRPFKAR
jgi:hypothetical protein